MTSQDNAPHLTLLDRRRPARSGQPWTDEDYEHLLALVREGLDAPEIAEGVQRSEAAIHQRLRALLPPDMRACLTDRVLPTLRKQLLADPDYPWADIMVQRPKPAPVITQVVNRAGIAGLEDVELAEVAWALLHCETGDEHLTLEVCTEAARRQLDAQLTERLARAFERRVPPLTPSEAAHAAAARFDRARGRQPVPYRPATSWSDHAGGPYAW